MNVIFFARRKKRTRTPQYLTDALRELGHDVKMVHYGRWTGILGKWLADALLLRRARSFGAELVLVWKDCISSSLLTKTLPNEVSKISTLLRASQTPCPDHV